MDFVPVEILARIFFFACGVEYSLTIDNTVPSEKVRSDAMRISHVCARWRHIVAEYSELWNSISIRRYNLTPDNLSLIGMFLGKSSRRSLNLRITTGHQDCQDVSEYDTEMWEMLKPHLSRCRELVLDADDFETLGLPLDDFAGFSFSQLEHYNAPSLRVRPSDIRHHLGWWDALRTAPKLTEVSAYGVPLSPLPYGQLKGLILSNVRANDIARFADELAPLTSNLEHLDMRLVNSERVATSPISIPSLRTLKITGSRQLSFQNPLLIELFSSISAPSLESLSVRFGCRNHEKGLNEPWPPAFLEMLRRSSGSLRELSLDFVSSSSSNTSFDDAEPLSTSSILEQAPKINSLRLDMGPCPSVKGAASTALNIQTIIPIIIIFSLLYSSLTLLN